MEQNTDSSLQLAPADLVSVKEAAQAAGVTPSTVQNWIARGTLTAYPHTHGRQVSLGAVRTLLALPDPQAPADARPLREVAQQAGVPWSIVQGWARQGRLPTWPSRHGRLIRVTDVQALHTRMPAPLPPYASTASLDPAPPDALPVWQVSRQTGIDGGRIHHWSKQGRLPSWRGPHGKLVRLADVQALAQHRSRASTAANEESAPR